MLQTPTDEPCEGGRKQQHPQDRVEYRQRPDRFGEAQRVGRRPGSQHRDPHPRHRGGPGPPSTPRPEQRADRRRCQQGQRVRPVLAEADAGGGQHPFSRRNEPDRQPQVRTVEQVTDQHRDAQDHQGHRDPARRASYVSERIRRLQTTHRGRGGQQGQRRQAVSQQTRVENRNPGEPGLCPQRVGQQPQTQRPRRRGHPQRGVAAAPAARPPDQPSATRGAGRARRGPVPPAAPSAAPPQPVPAGPRRSATADPPTP